MIYYTRYTDKCLLLNSIASLKSRFAKVKLLEVLSHLHLRVWLCGKASGITFRLLYPHLLRADMEGLFSKSFPPLPSTSPSMNRPLFNPLSSFSSLSSLNVQVLEREAGDNKPFRAKATVTDPAATVKIEVVKNSLSGLSSMIISSDLSSTTHSDDRRVDGQLFKLTRFTKQREASMIPLPSWVDAATLSASSIADGKEILIEAKPLSAKSSNNNMIPKMTEAVPISSSTMASPASIDLSSTPPEWKDGWMVGP